MNKKESIFNAALKLFVENGFHGTATAKIAQEAGVGTGTLFTYFKTKDDLIVSLYIAVKEEMMAYLIENTSNKSEIKDIMKSQFLASLFWSLDNMLKFRFIQLFLASPFIGELEQEVIEQQSQVHLMLIQRGIGEGVIKNLPVDFIYSLISSQAFGLHQYITSKKITKVEQHVIIQKTFEMLWDMIT
jgi:AcrR family transcriptional regulator